MNLILRTFSIATFICCALITFARTGNLPVGLNVRDFGAIGDGKTLDTESINKAIDAAARSGGGTVYFPAGTYATHSIHLKSNISLYIDQGATILAADPGIERPPYFSRSLHPEE